MNPILKPKDKVRIKERKHNETDYKYCFTKSMTALEGKVMEVKYVIPNFDTSVNTIPDDNACYKLYGDGHLWASSMLEKVV